MRNPMGSLSGIVFVLGVCLVAPIGQLWARNAAAFKSSNSGYKSSNTSYKSSNSGYKSSNSSYGPSNPSGYGVPKTQDYSDYNAYPTNSGMYAVYDRDGNYVTTTTMSGAQTRFSGIMMKPAVLPTSPAPTPSTTSQSGQQASGGGASDEGASDAENNSSAENNEDSVVADHNNSSRTVEKAQKIGLNNNRLKVEEKPANNQGARYADSSEEAKYTPQTSYPSSEAGGFVVKFERSSEDASEDVTKQENRPVDNPRTRGNEGILQFSANARVGSPSLSSPAEDNPQDLQGLSARPDLDVDSLEFQDQTDLGQTRNLAGNTEAANTVAPAGSLLESILFDVADVIARIQLHRNTMAEMLKNGADSQEILKYLAANPLAERALTAAEKADLAGENSLLQALDGKKLDHVYELYGVDAKQYHDFRVKQLDRRAKRSRSLFGQINQQMQKRAMVLYRSLSSRVDASLRNTKRLAN